MKTSTAVLSLALLLTSAGQQPGSGQPASPSAQMTEVTRFDNAGYPVSQALKNSLGKQVATKRYSRTWVTLLDSSGAVLHTWARQGDRGEVKNPMLLCLDRHGNIVRDRTGKPVMVAWFEAEGTAQTERLWGDGWQVTEEIRRIATCNNCAQNTANRCANVW